MPTHTPPLPKAPQPTKVFFDPYNSTSTGHQRAHNRLSGSTSWRDSRTYKLKHQLSDATGRGGQSHLSDLVGAGSENFGKDGRKENGDWEKGASGLRENGWQDIRELMGGGKKRKSSSTVEEEMVSPAKRRRSDDTTTSSRHHDDSWGQPDNPTPPSSDIDAPPFPSAQPRRANSTDDTTHTSSQASDPPPDKLPIFRGLTIYLNGSTAPLISDHHLKQLFSQHGGSTSIALGRRTVTHVVVGEDAGGGLAGTKIQKEVANVRGKGIKFVTARWVLDSVERGVRQPEARYVPRNLGARIGGAGQGSVRGIFGRKG